jgi:hypothetical protein
MSDIKNLEAQLAAAYAEARKLPEPLTGGNATASGDVPPSLPAPVQARPATEVWGSNEYDFVCPSGAQCRMRKLAPEKLVEYGILDKLTNLPGIAAEVVEKAEAVGPPTSAEDKMPSTEEMKHLLGIMEILIPAVVVAPVVFPVPADGAREVGRIYTDSIDLADRIAIMERAVGGTKAYEAFRTGSSQPV